MFLLSNDYTHAINMFKVEQKEKEVRLVWTFGETSIYSVSKLYHLTSNNRCGYLLHFSTFPSCQMDLSSIASWRLRVLIHCKMKFGLEFIIMN